MDGKRTDGPIAYDATWWRDINAQINASPDIADDESDSPCQLNRHDAANAAWYKLRENFHGILRDAAKDYWATPEPLQDEKLGQLAMTFLSPRTRPLMVRLLRPFIEHIAREILAADLPDAIAYILNERGAA